MYLKKRARPDIQLSVSFLCTIVRDPDADDHKKLAKVMKFIQGAIGLTLILPIEDMVI